MRNSTLALLLLGLVLAAQLQVAHGRSKGGASDSAARYVDDDDDEFEDDTPVKGEKQYKAPPTVPEDKGSQDKGQGWGVFGGRKKEGGGEKKGAFARAQIDEDDEEFDEDEFEGFEGGAARANQAMRGPPPMDERDYKAKATDIPVPGQEGKGKRRSIWAEFEGKTPMDFPYEMLGLAALVAYLTNYFYGAGQNRAVANRWLNANMDLLDDNFACIGIDGSRQWRVESADEFHLYCSGRVNCESCTVIVRTPPRQDLIVYLYQALALGKVAEDSVMLEVMMGTTPETGSGMEQYNFAIYNKSEEAGLRSEYSGLESSVAVKRWKSSLHDSLACMADDEELPRELLGDALASVLNEHRHYIKYVYASGKVMAGFGAERAPRQAVKIMLNIRPKMDRGVGKGGARRTDADKIMACEAVTRTLLRYIDRCATYKFSSAAKGRIEKLIQKLAEMEFKATRAQREEEAQNRRIAKLLKEKEAIKSMSPEEAAKAQYKLEQREKKDKMKSKMRIAR